MYEHRLDETFIKKILWQTLQGVKYCHENQVRLFYVCKLIHAYVCALVYSQRCEA